MFLFGNSSPLFLSKQFVAMQTLGGAGALRILTHCGSQWIFIPRPTTANHKSIFEKNGLHVGSYPYFNAQTNTAEHVGFLSISNTKQAILSKISVLINDHYFSPPIHGARIVSTILKSHELAMEWRSELLNMQSRISHMRKALIANLSVIGNKLDLSYLSYLSYLSFLGQQKGLFCYPILNLTQVERLRSDMHIYIPANGRINLAALNSHNIAYVAEALLSVLLEK